MKSGRWEEKEADRGGKCRPEALPCSTRGSAQDPPDPCRGDEMRKGIFGRFWYHSLSFTKRKQAGLSGYQDRAESHSSAMPLQPAGPRRESCTSGLPGGDKASRSSFPLCWLFRDRSLILKHQTPQNNFVFLHKSPGVLNYILTLCGPCPVCRCLQGQAEQQVAGHGVLGLTWGTQEVPGS